MRSFVPLFSVRVIQVLVATFGDIPLGKSVVNYTLVIESLKTYVTYLLKPRLPKNTRSVNWMDKRVCPTHRAIFAQNCNCC